MPSGRDFTSGKRSSTGKKNANCSFCRKSYREVGPLGMLAAKPLVRLDVLRPGLLHDLGGQRGVVEAVAEARGAGPPLAVGARPMEHDLVHAREEHGVTDVTPEMLEAIGANIVPA